MEEFLFFRSKIDSRNVLNWAKERDSLKKEILDMHGQFNKYSVFLKNKIKESEEAKEFYLDISAKFQEYIKSVDTLKQKYIVLSKDYNYYKSKSDYLDSLDRSRQPLK